MAIQTEDLGNGLVRTYSDIGHYIIGGSPEGEYTEAVDPADKNRSYTESEREI